jgi:hypothetical protein
MDPPPPIEWLERHGAQRDVLDGLRAYATDWSTLWATCPRGDWLLGIAVRLGIDHAQLVRAAIACARTAEPYAFGDDGARVLDLAERWTRGQSAASEVSAAASRLSDSAARSPSPAAEASLRAAVAVGLGVVDRDVLVSAPAAAAEATIVATMDCGLEMAMGWAHRTCADAVREAIPWNDVAPLVG